MAATIEIRKGFKISFDELIQSVSRLDSMDLTVFLNKLNQMTSQQSNHVILQQEKKLIQQIKDIIPLSVLHRFKQLQDKLHKQTITDKEQSEMLLVTDFIEEKSAERILLLSTLAKIRNISILELISELKLKDYHG